MTRQDHKENATGVWASRSYPFCEDMQFQLLEWRVERLGWYVLGGLLVLAFLGLFSEGPLSSVTARNESSQFEVEYERFYRNGASSSMKWHIDPGPGTESAILLDRAFAEAFTVEAITPEPSRMVATPQGTRMVFLREEGAPLDVVLSVRPTGMGLIRPEVGLNGADQARLGVFIYP